jgi:hypothetical protein
MKFKGLMLLHNKNSQWKMIQEWYWNHAMINSN